MKLEVTRDVVNDLWPLYRSGEASPDSRSLVDAFLAEDLALATQLKETDMNSAVMPPVHLSPDAERRLVDDARTRARIRFILIGAAIGLTAVVALVALAGALFFMFGNR